MNPDFEYNRHLQRREELMRAARLEQLARKAEADRPELPRRLLLILSDVMIDGGVRLKRYARGATALRPLTGPDAHLNLIAKQ